MAGRSPQPANLSMSGCPPLSVFSANVPGEESGSTCGGGARKHRWQRTTTRCPREPRQRTTSVAQESAATHNERCPRERRQRTTSDAHESGGNAQQGDAQESRGNAQQAMPKRAPAATHNERCPRKPASHFLAFFVFRGGEQFEETAHSSYRSQRS